MPIVAISHDTWWKSRAFQNTQLLPKHSGIINSNTVVVLNLKQKLISLQLSRESRHVDAVYTLSYTDEHGELVNPLLNIDKAAALLLERADKCTSRFGEAIVLCGS